MPASYEAHLTLLGKVNIEKIARVSYSNRDLSNRDLK